MESLSSVGASTPSYTQSGTNTSKDANATNTNVVANADSSIFNFNGASGDPTVQSFQA